LNKRTPDNKWFRPFDAETLVSKMRMDSSPSDTVETQYLRLMFNYVWKQSSLELKTYNR